MLVRDACQTPQNWLNFPRPPPIQGTLGPMNLRHFGLLQDPLPSYERLVVNKNQKHSLLFFAFKLGF